MAAKPNPFAKGNPFAKPGKPEKGEIKKLGAKGAARDEKAESPAMRKREAKGKK